MTQWPWLYLLSPPQIKKPRIVDPKFKPLAPNKWNAPRLNCHPCNATVPTPPLSIIDDQSVKGEVDLYLHLVLKTLRKYTYTCNQNRWNTDSEAASSSMKRTLNYLQECKSFKVKRNPWGEIYLANIKNASNTPYLFSEYYTNPNMTQSPQSLFLAQHCLE